jgi:hypothetical protein
MSKARWKEIQAVLGTAQDGIPGKNDEAALTALREAALAEHRASKQQPKDASRTDWKPFREVSQGALEAYLPSNARFLAKFFIENGRRYGLNPLFLTAISKHETGNWTSNVFKTKANAMGISNVKGAVSQESYNDSIKLAAYSISRPGGYYAKAKTLADVGSVYAPTKGNVQNDPRGLNQFWSQGVSKFWSELESKVPYIT